MNIRVITEALSENGISYALLDNEEKEVRIPISEESREAVKKLAGKAGWKKMKDRSGDLYLYGMKHFLYYLVENCRLIICCQLACRSTLNDGWVPLDRKINGQALSDIRIKDQICYLGAEDELCYLLAKCVYTVKFFKDADRKRLEEDMSTVDAAGLLPKLEGVFFRFTDKILELLHEKKYDDIITALWRFAEY